MWQGQNSSATVTMTPVLAEKANLCCATPAEQEYLAVQIVTFQRQQLQCSSYFVQSMFYLPHPASFTAAQVV
jgi:hypothetical protein